MIFKITKNSIPAIIPWGVIAVSICLVSIHFLGCSRDVSRILQDTQDEQLTLLIAEQSTVPPMNEQPLNAPPAQKKDKDSIPRSNRPVSPCSVDSIRTSKNNGGFAYLHCGGETVGSLQVKPNAILKDTTISVASYSLEIFGLPAREYDFTPDGLQFSKPVELKLDGSLFTKADGSLAQTIAWLYFNPSSRQWQLLNTIEKSKDGSFHIQISHFSIYRAVTRSGVGVSQGGQLQGNSQ